MHQVSPPLSLLLLLCALFVGCDAGIETPDESGPITTRLQNESTFVTLAAALEATPGVRATLGETGPYTLFAPTDDAFRYIGTSTLSALLEPTNQSLLTRILKYHIVPGRISADALTDGAILTTLDGTELSVRREGEIIVVDDARIDLERMIEADNGLVYPIDDVLRSNLDIASRLLLVPIVTEFVEYAMDTGALAALDPASSYTIIAPIDAAFTRLGSATIGLIQRLSNADVKARIVDFHILPGTYDLMALPDGTLLPSQDGTPLVLTRDGGQVFIDGHPIISGAADTDNGSIYLLNDLLVDGVNLDQRLRISPTLTTFEAETRQRPDLVSKLRDEDPYTVFAFLNTGLDLLSQNTRDALEAPENDALFDRLIRYHFVAGSHPSSSLQDGDVLTTVDGFALPIQRIDNELFVGERKVAESDIETENGFLYRMEYAMLPPGDLIDTALLRGMTLHIQSIRARGLESVFRQAGDMTMIAFPDTLFGRLPGLINRPDLGEIIQFYASNERVFPLEHNRSFDPLLGPRRTIAYSSSLDLYLLDGLVPVFPNTTRATNGVLLTADGVSTPLEPEKTYTSSMQSP